MKMMTVMMMNSPKSGVISNQLIYLLLQQLLIRYISSNHIVVVAVEEALGGDIRIIIITMLHGMGHHRTINNLDVPTMIAILMRDIIIMTMTIIIVIIIEISIIIHHNVGVFTMIVTIITGMITRVVMEMSVDFEIFLVLEEGVGVEGMIADPRIIVTIIIMAVIVDGLHLLGILTIAAHHHHHHSTMIEGTTMMMNLQLSRRGTTLDGDSLNALHLIFLIVAHLRNIIVIVVEALTITTAMMVMTIGLPVVGEVLKVVAGMVAVTDMALAIVGGKRMVVLGRMVGLDRLPLHHTTRIIGLSTL